MNTISVQIERLKEKLEIAIKLDRKSSSEYLEEGDRAKFYRFSGADRHNFKLNPTLSIEQIKEWEAKYRSKLPLEYRAFIMEIGNGGAGPYFGMLSLEEALDGWGDMIEDIPSKTCLLLKEYQDDKSWAAEIVGEDWETKYESYLWSPEFGTLAICAYGCGCLFHIVLNGSLTGRIFFMESSIDSPPKLLPMANFLDWYESWLNLVITGDMKYYWG